MSFARQPPTLRRLAVLIAVAFLATSVATLARPSSALAWAESSFSASAEQELIALTNQSRAAAGRKALKVSSTLTSIARWRSQDMIDRAYFSHTIPGYGKVFKKMTAKGFCYNLAGENIGWNMEADSVSAERIHKMFMDSSGHRSNIIGKDWDTIGVGAYKSASGKKMYTVLFADKCGSTASKPTAKPKPKATAKPKPKPKPNATAKSTSKPRTVARATPRPTAKPKPRPTAEPKPTATPIPTPEAAPPWLIDRLDRLALATVPIVVPPRDPTTGPPITPATAANTEPGPPDDSPSAIGLHGLRIDHGTDPPGLVDTIVGGVTDTFFGA